jgi:hypothetical protein
MESPIGVQTGAWQTISAAVPVDLALEEQGAEKQSAFNHADFHRFHAHAGFLQPFDGGFHFIALAICFQTNDADFIGHASLPDVRHHFELVAELPDERFFFSILKGDDGTHRIIL